MSYPKNFMHIREPYGTLQLKDCIVEEHTGSGRFTVSGIVEKGGTYSFGFGHTIFSDKTGTRHTVFSVTKKELKQGYVRHIAM